MGKKLGRNYQPPQDDKGKKKKEKPPKEVIDVKNASEYQLLLWRLDQKTPGWKILKVATLALFGVMFLGLLMENMYLIFGSFGVMMVLAIFARIVRGNYRKARRIMEEEMDRKRKAGLEEIGLVEEEGLSDSEFEDLREAQKEESKKSYDERQELEELKEDKRRQKMREENKKKKNRRNVDFEGQSPEMHDYTEWSDDD